jgi:hypothetical protein
MKWKAPTRYLPGRRIFMCIRQKRAMTGVILLASLLLSMVTFAQNTTAQGNDWSVLRTVASGSKLVVNLKNGKTVEGKLSGASDSTLSLSVSNKPVDLIREDVVRVYRVSGKSAAKAALVGAGVGAGAGAVLGVAGGGNNDSFGAPSRSVLTAGLAVLGAGAGAIAGFLVGKGGHKRVLIYEHP